MFEQKIPYLMLKNNFDGFAKMLTVEQTFSDEHLTNIDTAVRDEIGKLALPDLAGKRVAITAGSRGITNAEKVIRALGKELRARGALPFVVPAMGSHGNATADGQLELLESLNITETTIEMPIISSLETVLLGVSKCGSKVYCDKAAFEADHTVVCGRVKPHTDFRGSIESGLCKMMVVGLGKLDGAASFHKTGEGEMPERIIAGAEVFIESSNVLFGLAIIDNPHHRTKRLEAVMRNEIMSREPELLKEAGDSMAKLPFAKFDTLIVDYFGKDINGCGMDPNVTGRFFYALDKRFEGYPDIKKIVVMRLTEACHGNASGLGVADFIPLKFAQAIDLAAIYTNCLNSRYCINSKIPTVMNSDLDAIYAASAGCGIEDMKDVKIVRIKNTLELERILVSENMIDEVKANPRLRIVGAPSEMSFDSEDNFIDLP